MTGIQREWIAGHDFIMLHRELVHALDGNYEAAMVLARIMYRAAGPGSVNGWWEATRAELQEETCLSEWKLDQAVKVLREVGYLESERITPHQATLRWRVVVESLDPEIENSSISEIQDSSISLSTKKVKNTPPTPPRGGGGFEEFWSMYPRKDGKADARRRWEKVIETTDPAIILAGLRAQVPFLQREATRVPGKNFCPMPAPWLNAGRWEDEVHTTNRRPVDEDFLTDLYRSSR